LEGKGMRFAIEILERSHFRLADTLFRPDFMKGSVIEQQYNGVRITPGTRMQWGSPITLIIGSGLEDEFIPVPDLLGKTYGEAKLQLDTLGITLVPVPDATVSDTVNAFIYKQNPSRYNEEKQFNYIKPGMMMDIWLSREMILLSDSTDNSNKTKESENNKSKRAKRTD
jgi:beta-lactam-binding protein with PASTA domain